MGFELSFIRQIQSLVVSSPILVSLAVFAARWVIFVFIFIAAGFLTGRSKEDRHLVAEAAWSAGLALALTTLIAFLVQRVRPYGVSESGIFLLIPPPLNTSFPSGHTATAFALASALALGKMRSRWDLYLIAIVVAFGRMAVGVHYPTDVLGGIILGVGSAYLVRFLHRAIRRPSIDRAVRRHHHS